MNKFVVTTALVVQWGVLCGLLAIVTALPIETGAALSATGVFLIAFFIGERKHD